MSQYLIRVTHKRYNADNLRYYVGTVSREGTSLDYRPGRSEAVRYSRERANALATYLSKGTRLGNNEYAVDYDVVRA